MTSRSATPLFTPRRLAALLAFCAAGVAPGIAYAQNGTPKDSGLKDNGSYGPVVAIVSPEYSDVLKGDTKIVIAVKPRRYPAAGVELLVDGKAVTGVLQMQTKFTWKTSLFVDGPHTLGVRVTDTQGFIGQAETMVYINNARKADSTSPILRWLGVENGQKLSGIAHVRVEADDNFGVKYVFLTVNSAITPDIKPAIASWIINRPPYEVALDTTRFKDGMYVLDALAFDAADNERNATRLTVGFFNYAQAPTEAPTENLSPKNSDSNTIGNSVAPSTSTSPLIAPPRVATIPQPREVTPPQSTVTTTDTGWIAATPSPMNTQTSQSGSQRITTTALASRPPLPTRAATPTVESPTPVKQAPVVHTPPTLAVRITKTPVVQAPLVHTPPTPTVRIAKTLVNKVAQAPSVSVAGQSNNNTAISLSSKSLNNQRLAVEPEIRWTIPGELHDTSKANGAASATLSSHKNSPAALSTPSLPSLNIAALPAGMHTLQLTAPHPAVPQIKSAITPGAQISQTTLATGPNTRIAGVESNLAREPHSVTAVIAARPTFVLPQAKAVVMTGKPNTVGTASTTSITQTQVTHRVFSAPFASSRVAASVSTPNLPTAPRLAFSPNLNHPSARAPMDAAIVVSPTSDTPIVHIVQNNETLGAIAKKYKMPLSALAAANDLKTNAKIVKGAQVLLPQTLVVSYKGQAVTGDVAPLLIGSTSVAPFRFLFEKQGGTMVWDANGQRVTARNANYEINLEIGSDKAIVNQKEVMMDMAAFLLSGRTMVPVRFFEKALQAKVEWEPSTGRIFVAMTP